MNKIQNYILGTLHGIVIGGALFYLLAYIQFA